MSGFQTLGLIAKQGDPQRVRGTLVRLREHLRTRALTVRLDAESAHLLAAPIGEALTLEQLGASCDLIVVVGGDGTLLHAARVMAAFDVPLLGINLGRLGFLVDVSPEQLETTLDHILAGEFESDRRALLNAQIVTDAAAETAADLEPEVALNDVTIHKWGTARLIELEIWIDGLFVSAQRSDGLIVSTPTGSTAYALSGGGPLVDPALDAMLLVPICPHDLSNRPLVVPGSRMIEVRVRGPEQGHVQVTCDGQTDLRLPPGARVRITRHPHTAHLLHPKGHNHYQILRAKLHWGGHYIRRTPSC
ncbi:NAD+ kinase [Allochromatium warmingii]|uniref:NAD kinase n=1 Tax=Allochromatium warmingii TaxID=61595 RepID=A0A1H3EH17_ALLWA|nr:NAD(+) kinase [Allochromatium warmingii]SDX77895.1 NAD+ kinase [Allochromatium warmingii]